MKITIQRKTQTEDGIFGALSLDWTPFTCVTLENKKMALQVGIWPLTFAYSPHFNREMPLINVPHRTWTWIHWANWPEQLEGCVAVGKDVAGDSIETSVYTWNTLFSLIRGMTGVTIEILNIPTSS